MPSQLTIMTKKIKEDTIKITNAKEDKGEPG